MSDNGHVHDNPAMFFKIVIVAVILYPILYYTLLNKKQDAGGGQSAKQERQEQVNNSATPLNKTTKQVEIVQPSCPSSELVMILQEVCRELADRHRLCTPEDVTNLEKHKLPKVHAKNNTTSEPRGTIVGCIAAGLLLTSLGAAFLELYKAKSQTPVKTTKAPMMRKCSLADLTVLKHTRKELVRRESILEVPEDGAAVKPMGFRPPPLYRRCSFPVGPSDPPQASTYVTYPESRRTSIDSRRLSIVDSRRGSVDCRKASIDNESPERRHWSRLVHRH